jgi:hypothetical protein
MARGHAIVRLSERTSARGSIELKPYGHIREWLTLLRANAIAGEIGRGMPPAPPMMERPT